jgi:glycogen debranching enzyme
MRLLRQLKISGDMGHELFNNIREGNWLFDYTVDRLGFMQQELGPLMEFMREYFSNVKTLDAGLKPRYGARVIEKVYNAAFYESLRNRLVDPFITDSEDFFLQKLAISSL